MKKLSKLTFLLLGLLLSGSAILPPIQKMLKERKPDVFNISHLALNIEGYDQRFDLSLWQDLLSGPFYYCGHGGESVAFETKDHKYVLKFFLIKSLYGPKKYPLPKPTHWIPSHRKKRALARRETRFRHLHKTMQNYQVAFERLGEKTGILGVHLASTPGLLPQVCLYDKAGGSHLLDLSIASFVLQKKAVSIAETFEKAETEEEKLEILQSLNTFFAEQAQEGMVDLEKRFMLVENYGFIENKPIALDMGKVAFDPQVQENPETETKRMQQLLKNWAKLQNLPSYD